MIFLETLQGEVMDRGSFIILSENFSIPIFVFILFLFFISNQSDLLCNGSGNIKV